MVVTADAVHDDARKSRRGRVAPFQRGDGRDDGIERGLGRAQITLRGLGRRGDLVRRRRVIEWSEGGHFRVLGLASWVWGLGLSPQTLDPIR